MIPINFSSLCNRNKICPQENAAHALDHKEPRRKWGIGSTLGGGEISDTRFEAPLFRAEISELKGSG